MSDPIPYNRVLFADLKIGETYLIVSNSAHYQVSTTPMIYRGVREPDEETSADLWFEYVEDETIAYRIRTDLPLIKSEHSETLQLERHPRRFHDTFWRTFAYSKELDEFIRSLTPIQYLEWIGVPITQEQIDADIAEHEAFMDRMDRLSDSFYDDDWSADAAFDELERHLESQRVERKSDG